MYNLKDNFVQWMNHLKTKTNCCEGADYCITYGDNITIDEGIDKAVNDENFKISWVPWVIKESIKNNEISKDLKKSLFKLLVSKNDEVNRIHCKKLYDNISKDLVLDESKIFKNKYKDIEKAEERKITENNIKIIKK